MKCIGCGNTLIKEMTFTSDNKILKHICLACNTRITKDEEDEMTFYHYTPSTNLESIKKTGLYHFGIAWFTTSEEPEPTVSLAMELTRVPPGRISLKRKILNKFSTSVELPGGVRKFSPFMNVAMLMDIFDTSEWYYTEDEIKPQAIATYEVQQKDGTWKKVFTE